jgi:carbon-monoxide dehydrogenase medium subunit
MYPSAFEYYRPASVPDVIKLLQQHPDAKLLAGGHSLLPLMKLRLLSPSAVIDLAGISGLSGVREEGDDIVIGAATTYDELLNSDLIRRTLPIIAEAADVVGDLQVRNRGTIGGSLAHADPASDMPAVVLALDARLKAVGPGGERVIPAEDFLVDVLTTALEPAEVLTEIIVPRPSAEIGMAYEKFAQPASGYAIVGVATVLSRGSSGEVDRVRLAVTGACPIPRRSPAAEQALAGQMLDAATIKSASQQASAGLEFIGDIHASEEYRAHLTRVFTERALTRALEQVSA